MFILFAAKIEADTINMEQLVYHVFRVRENSVSDIWVVDELINRR